MLGNWVASGNPKELTENSPPNQLSWPLGTMDFMKFNAYIDGFSLYKGALEKHQDLKWLNLKTLCESRRPGMQLGDIYYFTANIKERFKGDDAPRRQHAYLRVLKDQGIKVIPGKFRKDEDWLRVGANRHRDLLQPNLPEHFGLTQRGLNRAFKEAQPDLPQAKV